jgi:hypothetical protein
VNDFMTGIGLGSLARLRLVVAREIECESCVSCLSDAFSGFIFFTM